MRTASARFVDYRQLGSFRWTWPHFTPEEMADGESGELLIVPAFMDWLEEVRRSFDQPMIITSGYRTAEHQWRITERRHWRACRRYGSRRSRLG